MLNNSTEEDLMLKEPERNITFSLIFMIFSIIVSIFSLYKANSTKIFLETIYILIMTTTIFIILEFMNRLSYFFNGLIKINIEYEGNFMKIIKASFSLNNTSSIVFVFCIVSFLALINNFHNGVASFSFLIEKKSELFIDDKKITYYIIAFFCALCFSYFLINCIKLNECRAQKLEAFYELNGLDYGSSMACSYFFGYLKIILPSDGKQNEGLIGRIEKFEDHHNVSFPVKKLFILVPSSFYTPPDLKESSNNWLEAIPNDIKYDKDGVTQNRAGVSKRQYQNTFYKIIPGGIGNVKENTVHVVTEGASPLLTFFEVQQQSHRYSNTYREFKKEIGKSFYRTLKQLLNDNPDCRDLCELVYYEDYDSKGKKVNIAKILLQRIKELSLK
ncbi:stimulator of interferon genes protein homolog [Leptopilina boulardi]|uniref:stimulator of interferon genes protein homolog n=1 Tax=Leptopilina boulardi TaxID=63433 RepID=UPI0021F608F4|nr:stimulator of interferon genes protein homolog [Leptopilina boulardi]